jgi:Asp-tRNA(Asn)/Glu-tRNA(Gln) amidotransferase A subunit family amidase
VKWTATEMARAVRDRGLSALELVDAHIQRIEALDGRVNAVVVRRFDEARAEARAAEHAGAGGPLLGVPYANALGLPALSVPVMRDEASGMPVGVQLIGRPGHDAEILALAEVLERALGGFVDPEAAPASALRRG